MEGKIKLLVFHAPVFTVPSGCPFALWCGEDQAHLQAKLYRRGPKGERCSADARSHTRVPLKLVSRRLSVRGWSQTAH